MKKNEIKTNAMRILERNKIPYEAIQYECDEFIDGLHTAEITVSDRTDLEPYNQSGGVPAVVCLVHHGAIANVAYAHHKSNRKVSDEWVFGCQGTAEI